MSYNIMNKRASFQGSNSGSIEDMVDIHTNQTITGRKTITDLTASTLLVSNDLTASGIVSASAFYGDGTGLSGVTVDPDGINTQVQFNADGAFGASSNFVFNTGSSTLTVTGDITASANISASAFFGDGTGLTNVSTTVNAADLVGTLSASQIDHSSPLTNSAGNLTLKFAASNSGLTDDSGIKLDFGGLGATPYVDTYNIAAEDTSGNHFKITLGTVGNNIETSATNIIAGTLSNARLPSIISVSEVTASSGFSGDGSNLSNIAAGSTNQIQFHGFTAGDLAASSDLTFNDTTDTLTTKTGSFEAVSASTAQFGEITSNLIPETTSTYYLGSPDLSKRWASVNSVASNVSGLAVSVTGAIQHALGIGTLNPSYELDVTGTIAVNGQISASSYVSASSFAFADSIKIAGAPPGQDTVIDSNGNFYGDTIDVGTVSGSNIVVTDGAGGVEYQLPITDGANGQVMTTDGSGNLTFASVGGNNYVEYSSYFNGAIANTTTAYFGWTGYQAPSNLNSPFYQRKKMIYDGIIKSVVLAGEYTGGGSTAPDFEVALLLQQSSGINDFIQIGEATGSYLEFGSANYFTGSVTSPSSGSFDFTAGDVILLKITSQNAGGVSDRINLPVITVTVQYT